MSTVVLFGGLLGALYSLLQFFAAPIWGGISDRVGRRPVLLISVFGLFLSYVLWIFSGSFTLLIAARAIGGLMSGNLSIASAVVSDITDEKNRSKGMAFIGIAFALGFVFGPALGGILSLYNPLTTNPDWQNIGVNPFSTPAALAALLSFINFITIYKFFPETLKPG
jgi:MFS family permease